MRIRLYRDALGFLYLLPENEDRVYWAGAGETFDEECQALVRGELETQRAIELKSNDVRDEAQYLALWTGPGAWARDVELTRPHPVLGNLETYLASSSMPD